MYYSCNPWFHLFLYNVCIHTCLLLNFITIVCNTCSWAAKFKLSVSPEGNNCQFLVLSTLFSVCFAYWPCYALLLQFSKWFLTVYFCSHILFLFLSKHFPSRFGLAFSLYLPWYNHLIHIFLFHSFICSKPWPLI